MSENAYLAIAVVGTFVAALLLAARMSVSARSRRASAVLQAQLETAGVGAGQGSVQVSTYEGRAPQAIRGLSGWIRKVTPDGRREAVARKLVYAGNPRFMTAELFLFLRVAGLLGGGSFGYYVGVVNGPYMLGVFWVPLLAFVGYMIPGSWLDGRANARQEAIRRDLADMIDLLTISVEAGLAFDSALLHARRAMRGPLSDEVGRMLHEMQLGARRVDAMRHLADRSSVAELRSFVLAMVQADVFGVSVANVLRAQSQELRVKRRQRAEEKAMKTPVKLLFPMILCILPALLIVVVGPGAIRITEIFAETAPVP